MTLKKHLIFNKINIFVVLFSLILLITSCKNNINNKNDIINFKDCSGAQINIENKVDKIVCVDQSCSAFLTAFGLDSKIVGLHGSTYSDMWTPYFMGDEMTHMKRYGYKPSAEAMYKAQADIVFLKDSIYANELRKEGITAVCFDYTNIDELYNAIDMLGIIFGDEVKIYISNWKKLVANTIEKIQNDLLNLDEHDKKNVYYINASNNPSDLYSTFGGGTFYEYWIKTIGANLVTSEFENISSIEPEIILSKNPQTIIIGGYAEYSRKELLLSNKLWENVDAVRNNDIHLLPTSLASYDKFSVELPLLLQYTAHELYPEYCDFDGINILKEFYKDYYQIEFSDELLNNLLLGLYPDGTRMD